jgi:acyl phosphate:glycerol-3-phosphate acyltransferase
MNFSFAFLCVAAYLLGSLSFAVIVSRVMGLDDPRTYGSQNPGATNVLRSGSKKAAVLTLLLDALKGFVPVVLVRLYGQSFGFDDQVVACVALAAFVGHLYPVFFRFQGGKGVATAAGILLGIEPLLGLAVMATWLFMAAVFRYSSLAALVAAVASPGLYVLGDQQFWQVSPAQLLAVTFMSAILLLKHKQNILRLVAGQESKIGAKKDPAANDPVI